jgi:plasmid stability protein
MCYSDTVKNVTVTLPDDVYRKARIKAAERDTSVSALVREFLMQLGERDAEFDRRKKLQDEVLSRIRRFRASDRLSRYEVHDRDALR